MNTQFVSLLSSGTNEINAESFAQFYRACFDQRGCFGVIRMAASRRQYFKHLGFLHHYFIDLYLVSVTAGRFIKRTVTHTEWTAETTRNIRGIYLFLSNAQPDFAYPTAPLSNTKKGANDHGHNS